MSVMFLLGVDNRVNTELLHPIIKCNTGRAKQTLGNNQRIQFTKLSPRKATPHQDLYLTVVDYIRLNRTT